MRSLLVVLALLASPAAAQTAEQRAADAVCGKQVVVLGELPSHGEARTFAAKARIVERLVQRCGFDAVLFEAPMYDFVGFQKAGPTATAAQLDRAIGRFWTTRELAGWRGWLLERARAGRLVLAGLDDQVSATSDYARATLPGLVGASVHAPGNAECEAAIARNLGWGYGAGQEYDDAEKARLRSCTRLAALGLRAGTPEQAMLESLAGFYEREAGAPSAADRDEAMYRNFVWQNGRLPTGSKVIVWTATVHAARRQGDLPQKPLGARLAERWGDRVGVIGFTARGGRSSRAGQPSTPLPDAPAGSLEARAARADTAWSLLDARALRRMGPVPSRLFGRFTTARWADLFDAVLVIRDETAPTAEPRR